MKRKFFMMGVVKTQVYILAASAVQYSGHKKGVVGHLTFLVGLKLHACPLLERKNTKRKFLWAWSLTLVKTQVNTLTASVILWT